MAAKLTVSYDREGDILRIAASPPHPGQEHDMTDDYVLVTSDGEFGPVEAVEIFGFSKRFQNLSDELELPFSAIFSEVESCASREMPRTAN
jgi:uncharacterized protein YuzE